MAFGLAWDEVNSSSEDSDRPKRKCPVLRSLLGLPDSEDSTIPLDTEPGSESDGVEVPDKPNDHDVP